MKRKEIVKGLEAQFTMFRPFSEANGSLKSF